MTTSSCVQRYLAGLITVYELSEYLADLGSSFDARFAHGQLHPEDWAIVVDQLVKLACSLGDLSLETGEFQVVGQEQMTRRRAALAAIPPEILAASIWTDRGPGGSRTH